ncbi:ABC transporter ATP-binding protein [uncultured Methanoregula sp.]|uniref:ABC transporter ATP-binding protein n=1 Tax=uncultured Methanoregula sp. TaxID=1005933 RepID=UPI002AAC191E|nr:ABC transporter ATP-binding protein [uncultured Methanoregula sp.]
MSVLRDSFKILRFLFSPFKGKLALYLLVVIILSGLEVFRVSLVYPIINYGLGVQNQPKLLDTFYNYILPSSLNPFVASALLLILASVVIAVLYGIVAYYGSFLFASVRDSLDRRVFEKITKNQYSYFAARKQGDLLYIGQGAVNDASAAVGAFVDFIKNALTALFYLIFIFYLSFWLTVGLIIVGAVYALLVKKFLFSRVYRNSAELITAYMEKSVIYQEFISGIKTILITNSVGLFKKKYDYAVQKLLKTNTNVNALSKLPSIINDFIMFFLISFGAISLYIFTEGNFIAYIGIFGTLMLALYRLIPCVNTAQSNLSTVVQSLPSLTLVYCELTADSDIVRSENTSDKKRKFSFKDNIEFRDVSFGYPGSQQDTIHGISFKIGKNKKVAIVGNSGSGKTTTANLLALLYKPVRGGIFVDGVNINEFDPAEYLGSLGYIGQESFIFHDSIKENIRFGLDRSDQEIIEAAKRADAHEFIMSTDQGYNTIIGDQGLKLSGGQRQRVAIARIILRNPDILLLDEATSSLDNISEKKIIDSVQQLSENMTVITIAHRLSTIHNADVIHVMKNGEIVESGTHDALMEKRGEYYQLYLGQEKEE